MVLGVADSWLVVANVLLVGVLAVQYRRGAIRERKLRLTLASCLTWLAYGLLQVTQDGPIPTGTPLNYGLDAVAVCALVAGIYLLYRGWRYGDDGTESSATSG